MSVPRPVFLACLLATALLSGCGQKGALYLPEKPQAPDSEQNSPQKP
ncbi:MAG: lipoprotein [Candidatus Competibacteraceae bacterium]|nr:lipoprotein [Candidatus Competibacteraceae bacterium]